VGRSPSHWGRQGLSPYIPEGKDGNIPIGGKTFISQKGKEKNDENRTGELNRKESEKWIKEGKGDSTSEGVKGGKGREKGI